MRQPRFVVPDQPQHVIQRGNNHSEIFADESDYVRFHNWLSGACHRHGALVHAYVFMTNHVHLLLTPRAQNAIASVMQSVGRRYVRYFNDKYERTGTLWEGRYRATLIDTEEYLFTCYRYIELNPVRAGLVAHPRQYRWSSHGANALGRHDPLIVPHERYQALGRNAKSRAAEYRGMFHSVLDERTIADIREATNKAWALGRVSEQTEILLNRRAHPVTRGRPPFHGEPACWPLAFRVMGLGGLPSLA